MISKFLRFLRVLRFGLKIFIISIAIIALDFLVASGWVKASNSSNASQRLDAAKNQLLNLFNRGQNPPPEQAPAVETPAVAPPPASQRSDDAKNQLMNIINRGQTPQPVEVQQPEQALAVAQPIVAPPALPIVQQPVQPIESAQQIPTVPQVIPDPSPAPQVDSVVPPQVQPIVPVETTPVQQVIPEPSPAPQVAPQVQPIVPVETTPASQVAPGAPPPVVTVETIPDRVGPAPVPQEIHVPSPVVQHVSGENAAYEAGSQELVDGQPPAFAQRGDGPSTPAEFVVTAEVPPSEVSTSLDANTKEKKLKQQANFLIGALLNLIDKLEYTKDDLKRILGDEKVDALLAALYNRNEHANLANGGTGSTAPNPNSGAAANSGTPEAQNNAGTTAGDQATDAAQQGSEKAVITPEDIDKIVSDKENLTGKHEGKSNAEDEDDLDDEDGELAPGEKAVVVTPKGEVEIVRASKDPEDMDDSEDADKSDLKKDSAEGDKEVQDGKRGKRQARFRKGGRYKDHEIEGEGRGYRVGRKSMDEDEDDEGVEDLDDQDVQDGGWGKRHARSRNGARYKDHEGAGEGSGRRFGRGAAHLEDGDGDYEGESAGDGSGRRFGRGAAHLEDGDGEYEGEGRGRRGGRGAAYLEDGDGEYEGEGADGGPRSAKETMHDDGGDDGDEPIIVEKISADGEVIEVDVSEDSGADHEDAGAHEVAGETGSDETVAAEGDAVAHESDDSSAMEARREQLSDKHVVMQEINQEKMRDDQLIDMVIDAVAIACYQLTNDVELTKSMLKLLSCDELACGTALVLRKSMGITLKPEIADTVLKRLRASSQEEICKIVANALANHEPDADEKE